MENFQYGPAALARKRAKQFLDLAGHGLAGLGWFHFTALTDVPIMNLVVVPRRKLLFQQGAVFGLVYQHDVGALIQVFLRQGLWSALGQCRRYSAQGQLPLRYGGNTLLRQNQPQSPGYRPPVQLGFAGLLIEERFGKSTAVMVPGADKQNLLWGRVFGLGNPAINGEGHPRAQQSYQDEFAHGAFHIEAMLGPPRYQIKS